MPKIKSVGYTPFDVGRMQKNTDRITTQAVRMVMRGSRYVPELRAHLESVVMAGKLYQAALKDLAQQRDKIVSMMLLEAKQRVANKAAREAAKTGGVDTQTAAIHPTAQQQQSGQLKRG